MEIIQVGELGKNRDKFLQKVTRSAGKGNWFWAFKANKKLYSWQWGLQLYEDAYWQFLRGDFGLVKELVGFADVFVYNRHDLDSKLNYKHQKQDADHYQDIAIRRCLIRFGIWFGGKDLLQISTTKFDHSEIPFHMPHLLHKPDAKNSAQSWLNKNRLIVITENEEDKFKLADLLVQ